MYNDNVNIDSDNNDGYNKHANNKLRDGVDKGGGNIMLYDMILGCV